MRLLAAVAALAAALANTQEVIAAADSAAETSDPRISHNSQRTSHSLALGISNGCVPDEKLTASSERKVAGADYSASRSRLLLDKEASLHVGWRPGKDDASPWLEIDLGRETVIGSVGTQGGFDLDAESGNLGNAMWVESYDLSGSVDGVTWDTVSTHLPGNSDGDGIVTRDIGAHSVEPVRARFLRFVPVKCGMRAAVDGTVRSFAAKDSPFMCALRVEVYGYSVCSHGPCHVIHPLGVGLPSKMAQAVNAPHRPLIADGAMRASSYLAPSSAPFLARLNAQPRPFREGGWTPQCHKSEDGALVCSHGASQPEYLQVDLGRELEINAVATQGSGSVSAWVTRYELAFSNDGRHWAKAMKPMDGNADASGVVKNSLPRPVLARYVRIIPVAWAGKEKGRGYAMRWELYGPQGYSKEEERAWLAGWPTRGMCRLQRPSCKCGDNAKAPLPLEAPGTKSTCPCRRYTLQLLSRAIQVPTVAYGPHYGETLDYLTAALSTLQSAAEAAAASATKAVANPSGLRGTTVAPAFVKA